MLRRLRGHLSYANVVATLALFVALGGSSYAAFTISGSDIRNRSIPGKKLKRNTLTGREIRESKLAVVPRARNAARVGGLTAQRLLVSCPSDTIPIADTCIEEQPRAPATYSGAIDICAHVDSTKTPGRRLPTHDELSNAFTHEGIQPAPGGELTSDVYPSSSVPGKLEVLYVTDSLGHVALTPDTAAGAKAYRCVADPLN